MPLTLTLQLLHLYRPIWWTIFCLSALPALFIVWRLLADQLGSNPLEVLQQTTGCWALTFLLITLAVTPARQLLNRYCIHIHVRYGRRLEDWNWLVRLRRMLGLYCFFYASLHMLVYAVFDLSLEWQWALQDIQEKPYIILGVLSYLMLIPLAITSHSKLFRLMGRPRWLALHRTVYIINILVIIHFIWQTKVGVYSYLPYALITAFLLGFRLLNWSGILHRSAKDDGLEVEIRK